jgi:hypothetical protein
MPLREPLVPLTLFRHRQWVISAILTGIGAGVYYAGAGTLPETSFVQTGQLMNSCATVVWPQLTQNFYANGNPTRAAFLSSMPNLGILIGGGAEGIFAKPIGHQKWQILVAMAIGGALLACKLMRLTPLIRSAD